MLIDTHAHYDDAAYDEDRGQLIDEMNNENIIAVNVGASLASTFAAVALSEKYENIYAGVGMHPDEVAELTEDDMDKLIELSSNKKVVTIGEIGLDYYWDNSPRDIQKKWFIRQIEVARQVKLPVSIHSREAAQDTFDIISKHHAYDNGGIVHCYSYGLEMAKEYLKMGMCFGIGGVVTFKNSKKLKEVVDYIPMENIVLETDSPYLAPVPHRGERNSSRNLVYVAEAIAQIKGLPASEVIDTTTLNAKRVYGLN